MWLLILLVYFHVCGNKVKYSDVIFVKILNFRGEGGGLVVNASDSGSRVGGGGFEPHSGQTVLCP